METELIAKARRFAFQLHEGQMYGTFPYIFHLVDVVKILVEFGYDKEDLIAAGNLHDCHENCGIPIETLTKHFNEKVSDLVYCVSGFGINRKERKADMLNKLQNNKKAVALKMADRLANMRHGAKFNTRMLDMYKKELPDYKDLFIEENYDMYQEMTKL